MTGGEVETVTLEHDGRSVTLTPEQVEAMTSTFQDGRVIRFRGLVKGPGVKTDAEGQNVLSFTVQVTRDGATHDDRNLYALHHRMDVLAANSVVDVILLPGAKKGEAPHPDQMTLPTNETLEGEDGDDARQDLVCSECGSCASSEYVTEGRACLGCGKGAYMKREVSGA